MKRNFSTFGSIIENSRQEPIINFYTKKVYEIFQDLMQAQYKKSIAYHVIQLTFYHLIMFSSKHILLKE